MFAYVNDRVTNALAPTLESCNRACDCYLREGEIVSEEALGIFEEEKRQMLPCAAIKGEAPFAGGDLWL